MEHHLKFTKSIEVWGHLKVFTVIFLKAYFREIVLFAVLFIILILLYILTELYKKEYSTCTVDRLGQ